jgi:rhodanese-related sulfurtransferase
MKFRVSHTIFIVLALVLLVVGLLYYYAVSSPLLLTAEEAKKRIKDGNVDVVLDVRTDLEYNLGHYSGAVHIPTAELIKRAPKELPSKESQIIVYCNTGQRARAAAELLHAAGYKNTRYIANPYWSLTR